MKKQCICLNIYRPCESRFLGIVCLMLSLQCVRRPCQNRRHTFRNCSSSAQSVWAEVKTNTMAPVAGSQEAATASVEEGCYLLLFLFPRKTPEVDVTGRKTKNANCGPIGLLKVIPPSAVRVNMVNKHLAVYFPPHQQTG